MRAQTFNFEPFELQVLTPVHIGSGEDFSPLGYVLRQTEQQREIWLIDTAAWLAGNFLDKGVESALNAGFIKGLRKLLNSCPKLERYCIGKIRVPSALLAQELAEKRDDDKYKAEIASFARNPFTHLPYLPGTSLKGALSTALTDYLDAKRQADQRLCASRDKTQYDNSLKELYGSIGDHAMATLKVADISLPPNCTCIRQAKGWHETGKEDLEKTPCETISEGCKGLFGNLRMAGVIGSPAILLRGGKTVSLAGLRKICNDFYAKRFNDEYARFYQTANPSVARALGEARERIASLDPEKELLLRIGHYSHVECVTIRGAKPRTPNGVYGTTRTLTDSSLPFGWVILKACSLETYQAGIASVTSQIQAQIDRNAQRLQTVREDEEKNSAALQAARNAREQELAVQRKEEQEAEQARVKLRVERLAREQAEKENAAMLADLSPEERLIWEVEQPDVIENKVTELYNMLDQLSEADPPLRKRAAEALRKFWEQAGKWQGSQTPKQADKVSEVKAILGVVDASPTSSAASAAAGNSGSKKKRKGKRKGGN